jgi:hypothetical protein
MLKASVYERWGHGGLAEFWQNPANFPTDEFPSVAGLFGELRAWRERRRETDPETGRAQRS